MHSLCSMLFHTDALMKYGVNEWSILATVWIKIHTAYRMHQIHPLFHCICFVLIRHVCMRVIKMMFCCVIYVSCMPCFLVCSLQTCGHLLGKGWPLGSIVCDVFLYFVTFPCGVLGQMWYLIVSISDICLLPYFNYL